MTSIRFNPNSDLILLSMKVEGVDERNFRDVWVALDTGASTTFLSPEEALILSLMMVMNGLHFKRLG